MARDHRNFSLESRLTDAFVEFHASQSEALRNSCFKTETEYGKSEFELLNQYITFKSRIGYKDALHLNDLFSSVFFSHFTILVSSAVVHAVYVADCIDDTIRGLSQVGNENIEHRLLLLRLLWMVSQLSSDWGDQARARDVEGLFFRFGQQGMSAHGKQVLGVLDTSITAKDIESGCFGDFLQLEFI